VTPGAGLLPANDYLSVAIFYLFAHRPQWSPRAAVGKTVVSSRMIDRVAAKLRRPLHEVPVGGEPVQRVLTHAPGNGAPIDGVKVEAASAWFAARPSGTEDVYKIYAESFRSADHLRLVLEEAQTIVDDVLG